VDDANSSRSFAAYLRGFETQRATRSLLADVRFAAYLRGFETHPQRFRLPRPGGCSQPTYEDLKLASEYVDAPTTSGSQPTYEDLKHGL